MGGTVTSYASRFLGGAVQYGTSYPEIPANCYPSYTRFTETNRYGGGFSAAGLVVDAVTNKGGIIWDRPDLGAQSLDFSPLLNTNYPSFGLLMEATGNRTGRFVEEASGYRFQQQDIYSCVR